MMKTADVSLYDVLGYLLPGVVGSVGLYLVLRSALGPVEHCWVSVSPMRGAALLLGAYIVGHIMQALGNQLEKMLRINPQNSILEGAAGSEARVIEKARQKARQLIGLPSEAALTNQTLFDIMDHHLQQHGQTATHEVYVYREGFYRALSIACILVAVGCLCRAFGDPVHLSLFAGKISATRPLLYLSSMLALTSGVLFQLRYRRFSKYRVRNILYCFSVMKSNP